MIPADGLLQTIDFYQQSFRTINESNLVFIILTPTPHAAGLSALLSNDYTKAFGAVRSRRLQLKDGGVMIEDSLLQAVLQDHP